MSKPIGSVIDDFKKPYAAFSSGHIKDGLLATGMPMLDILSVAPFAGVAIKGVQSGAKGFAAVGSRLSFFEKTVVKNSGLRNYISRASKLELSPISTVAEADFGYLNKAHLTKAQAAVVRRIESAISKHAKPHDFIGVEKELAGIRIPKSLGGYFNHVQEMRNTITHLDKQMISIENSLKNPMLDSASRQTLSQAHELARDNVLRMSNSLTSDLGISAKPLGVRP